VHIAQLPAAAIDALAAGDLAGAEQAAGRRLSAYLVAPESRRTWRYRSAQLAADPSVAGWITGAVVDLDLDVVVGRAGFHGPPDERGMVEVGYAIDPAHRRGGYARAALVALLDRAEREPAVRVVRASIRPDNTASLALVEQYGFAVVGEQDDDEDGRELVLEVALPVDGQPAPRQT
jgi:RimJ/RimL family protein N-acetyltransferase